MTHYVVLDTESSVDQSTRTRVLVSLAYEIVDAERRAVVAAGYDVVKLPPDIALDAASQRVHGITVREARRCGREVPEVLERLCAVLARYAPAAAVGHDVAGDVALLVGEGLRSGFDAARLAGALPRRLLCTKLASAARCRIPLPKHLRYPYPCDVQLARMAGTAAGGPRPGAARFKWPSLEESYQMLVAEAAEAEAGGGADAFPAHDARGDVERCRRVFLRLLVAP